MALVAALGACTQEEFNTPVDTNEQNLAVRPLLGDIQITTDPQTRFALNEDDATKAQPVFAEGDKLGAAIIDVPTYNTSSGNTYENKLENATNGAVDLYNIVEYYSSNNCFTLSNGIWTVDQPMVEGNYLFYAPYNQKMQQRTPLSITLPEEQDASETRSALEEFYNSGNVVRVGYQFLAAQNGEAQKPEVAMNDVFAYPLFTIVNDFAGWKRDKGGNPVAYSAGAIKLDKMEVSIVDNTYEATDVVCGGLLKHAGTSVTGLTAADGVVGTLNGELVAGEAGADWLQTPMENYTKQLLSDANQTKGKVITTFTFGGKELAANDTYQFYGVLPADEYTKEDGSSYMRVALYVTIGEKQYIIEQANKSGNSISNEREGLLLTSSVEKVTLIKGQKYPQEELNFDRTTGLDPKPSAGDILTISNASKIDKYAVTLVDEVSEAQTRLIENNAEFIQFFKDQLNGSNLQENNGLTEIDNTQPQYAIAEKNTVVINSELIEALSNYNNRGTLMIATAVPVAKDVTITNVTDNTDSYIVTFESSTGVTYPIELETSSGGYVVTTGAAVSVAEDIEKTVIVNGDVTSVTNNGTIHTLYVTETGALHITSTVAVDAIVNDGLVEVEAGLTANEIDNRGTWDVYGAEVVGGIENDGTVRVRNAGAILNVIAGNGYVKLPEDYAAAVVTANEEQIVIYQITGDFSKAKIDAAAKLALGVDEVVGANLTIVAEEGENNITLDDLKKFTGIRVSGNITSNINGTMDFSGLTLRIYGVDSSWTGLSANYTIVNNVDIDVIEGCKLTLRNINANGTVTKGEGAKLVANGTTSFWNGAESDNE